MRLRPLLSIGRRVGCCNDNHRGHTNLNPCFTRTLAEYDASKLRSPKLSSLNFGGIVKLVGMVSPGLLYVTLPILITSVQRTHLEASE